MIDAILLSKEIINVEERNEKAIETASLDRFFVKEYGKCLNFLDCIEATTHVCLTHIPPQFIGQVTSEISRVTKKWIIHMERYAFMYEHPSQHRWSHLIPPFYIDTQKWDLWECGPVKKNDYTYCTKLMVFRRIEPQGDNSR